MKPEAPVTHTTFPALLLLIDPIYTYSTQHTPLSFLSPTLHQQRHFHFPAKATKNRLPQSQPTKLNQNLKSEHEIVHKFLIPITVKRNKSVSRCKSVRTISSNPLKQKGKCYRMSNQSHSQSIIKQKYLKSKELKVPTIHKRKLIATTTNPKLPPHLSNWKRLGLRSSFFYHIRYSFSDKY